MTAIYLDNNATRKIYKEVIEAMKETYSVPLNASSIHSFGRNAKRLLEQSRSKISQFLHADNYNVIFTSSGTESNNQVIRGFSDYKKLISSIEHPSLYRAADDIYKIPVDNNGIVNLLALKKLLVGGPKKTLVSVMHANNETGIIQPVVEIAKICKENGILFHTDAVQTFGKVNFKIDDLSPDFMTISAHKIGGPQGAAALLVRKNFAPFPFLKGGGQEFGFRAGSENIPAIVGFAKAVEITQDKMNQLSQIGILRDYMENKLKQICPEIVIIGEDALRIVNTSCIIMPNVANDVQLVHFDLKNIAVSSGAACSSGKVEASYVLQAMNVPQDKVKNAIRVSLSLDNNYKEIDNFIEAWQELYLRNKDSNAAA